MIRLALTLVSLGALVLCGDAPEPKEEVAEVESFRATYRSVATPSEDWDDEREKEWILGFEGKLTSGKMLAYRSDVLPAGTHDLWVEKGKDDWYRLFIGNRQDEEAPRLKAIFKLYELEAGVERLRFELKLTRKGTRLRFSLLAGRSEAHGNLRIEEAS